jgi:dUTP pyrophosphatase
MSILKIIKLSHNAKLPFYATSGSAGMDLSYCGENKITIRPNQTAIVPTGIAISLEKGYEAQIRPRSGLAAKNSITVLNTPGTIDSDYRGEIKVILINLGNEDFVLENEMRIAQMIISKYDIAEILEVKDLDNTDRGSKGFGSTGIM